MSTPTSFPMAAPGDPDDRRYGGFIDSMRGIDPDRRTNPIGMINREALRLFAVFDAPPGHLLEPRVRYGAAGAAGYDLRLLLYRPIDGAQPRPGIVIAHGGSWRAGFPELHLSHARAFAADGYVSASIAFRTGAGAWPGSVEDAKCAVRWMRANAAELGVDPRRIAILGQSTGGWLAAMVALTPGAHEGTGGHPEQSSEPAAAVLMCAPTDLRAGALVQEPDEDLDAPAAAFLDADAEGLRREEASPIVRATSGAPPILSIAGRADNVVPLEGVERFHQRLDELGVRNRLEIMEGDHGFAWTSWDATYSKARAFLDKELKAVRPTEVPPH